jgi:hypothetical protein
MLNVWEWLKNNHDSLHVILLIAQIIATGFIGYFAYNIQAQNYQIQEALYDFEPQINGFVNDIIWVYEHEYQAVANIEVLINSPHSGNFTLQVNRFYPKTEYLNPERLGENHLDLQSPIRDSIYPQAYRFRANVNLIAHIYPKQNLTNIVFFNAGVLEFQIVYYDISKKISYTKLFNGTVWFEFAQ